MAQRIAPLIPPHPSHLLSCDRGVAAWVLAILAGHPALDTVGRRLDERGRLPLLHPGLEATSVPEARLGQILEALCAAHRKRGFGALALNVLETYAIEAPWMHQDTTTVALYGAYDQEAAAPAASRPS